MIRPTDYVTVVGHNDRGLFVHVVHTPTGHERLRESIAEGAVNGARESIIAELRELLAGPKDIVFYTGRSSGGDFISVKHIPTGIERCGMRRETTHENLLDAVLEEVYRVQRDHGLKKG